MILRGRYFGEPDLYIALQVAPFDRKGDDVADLLFTDIPGQFRHVLYRLSVHFGDNVPGGDTLRPRRALLEAPRDEDSLVRAQVVILGDLLVKAYAQDAEPGPNDLAVLDELLCDGHRAVYGYGKADALGERDVRGVHADNLAGAIQKGAAAVARIDVRVGLK